MNKKIVSLSLLISALGIMAPSTALANTNASPCAQSVQSNNQLSMYQGGHVQFSSMMNQNMMDKRFIEQMIPHHKMAIEMAKVELEKGTKTDIRAMAQNIISSQSQEIDMLRNLYKQWYGTDVPEDMSMMNMGMMDQLRNASDVDHMFVQMMIPHHMQAVSMSRMEVASGNRSELKQMAQKMIEDQMREVQRMTSWLSN